MRTIPDRYWVGGGSDVWNNVANSKWSTTSGGAGGASAPTTVDDVYFDANSGNVTCSSSATCRNMICTGYTGTMTNNTGHIVAIFGGMTLSTTMTLAGTNTSTAFNFVSVTDNGGTGWPITTNGKTFPFGFTLNGVGGKWTLQDAFTCTGAITLTNGTLDTNNQTVSATALNASSGAKTFTFGSSAITLSSGSTALSLSASNTTVTANTATVTATSANVINLGSTNCNGLSVVITGTASVGVTTSGATLANLTRTGASVSDNLYLSGNLILTGTLTLTGYNSTTGRLLVYSDTLGTTRVITAAATSLTDVDFMDIAIVGPTGSTITSDSFNRSDGALAGSSTDNYDGGSAKTWIQIAGTTNIVSNEATSGSSGSNWAVVDAGTDNYYVEVTLGGMSAARAYGALARVGDANNCLYAVASNASGAASNGSFGYILNGAATNFVSGSNITGNPGFVTGDVIGLQVCGNAAAMYRNGLRVTPFYQIPSSLVGNNVGISSLATAPSSVDNFRLLAQPNVIGTRLGDCLGNSGIEFTTASGTPRDGGGAGVKRYAVAPGNFSSTAMWSESSGGAPGASVPLPQDDVYLDANSAAGNYSMNMPRLCRNLDSSGAPNTVKLRHGNVSFSIYGNLNLGSETTGDWWIGVSYRGRTNHTITTNGNVLTMNEAYFFCPGGTYTLQDSYSGGLIYPRYGGHFNTNNQNLSCVTLTVTDSATLSLGTSNVTFIPSVYALGCALTAGAGCSINAASSTITFPAIGTLTHTFAGGGYSYGTVTYTAANSPGALTISGSNTFNTVNIGAGRSLRLTSGTTQKIGTLNVNPAPINGVYLPSSALITIPDSASSSVTGDFDIRYRVKMPSWASNNGNIFQKMATGNQLSWYLSMNATSRNLQFGASLNGSTIPLVAQATGYFGLGDDNATFWIRVTRRASDGRVQFFRADDSTSVPTSWTQIGNDVTASSGTLFDSTAALQIGGGNYANPATGYMPQTAYYLQILNGIDGAPVIDIDFTKLPQPYWQDGSGNNNHASTTSDLALVGDGRVAIKSVTAGSAASLQLDSSTNLNYVDLQDVVMNGADTYIGATSVIRTNVKGARRGPKTGLGV